MPGVAVAASGLSLPGVPTDYTTELSVEEGRSETEPKVVAQSRAVSPEYFSAVRIPVLAGELCRDEANAPAAMVNRAFANAYFAHGSPIGYHVSGNIYLPRSVVRGIVGDARETGMDREPIPTVYWCFNAWQPGLHFLVRTHGDPQLLTETIRKAVNAIEPTRSVYDVAPLVDHISGAYAENRLRTILLVFFGAAAILLACVGLYGPSAIRSP